MKLPKELYANCVALKDKTIDSIVDDINDYLSDTYGFCVNDFSFDIDIEINNIDWDKTE